MDICDLEPDGFLAELLGTYGCGVTSAAGAVIEPITGAIESVAETAASPATAAGAAFGGTLAVVGLGVAAAGAFDLIVMKGALTRSAATAITNLVR